MINPTDPPAHPSIRRGIVGAGIAIAAAALVVVLVANPSGIAASRDPGAPEIPLPLLIGPSAIGIALALLVPPRRRRMPVHASRPVRLLVTTSALVALAAAFPLSVGLLGIGGEDYIALKALLFIVLPLTVVAVLRGAVRVERTGGAWRWWAPLGVVAIWAILRSSTSALPDYGAVPTADLLIAATATAITAGFGEELFYRRLLQTRLEALLGGWPGIVLASLAFALMHLGSHGSDGLVVDVASVIVVQGAFGVFMGVLWWRFRNLTLIGAAHVLANGWPEIVLLALSR